MTRYAEWLKLEQLLHSCPEAKDAIRDKYPALINKWEVLRRRMGRDCPMSRQVLKLIVLHEKDNNDFIRSTEEGTWITRVESDE